MTTAQLLPVLALALLAATMTDWGAFARRVVALVRRAPQRLRLRGEWRAELRGPGGELKGVREWSQNIIVNDGLDYLVDLLLNPATVGATMHYVAIGTDATPEVATDAALGAEVARAAGAFTAGGVGVGTVEYTFPAAGGYEPAAIAEAALWDDPAAGTMFNRKTFPAFTKQAADTLKVTCTVTATSA